jgi:PKD repeat protein
MSSSSQSDKISSCSMVSLDDTESENIVVTNTIDNEYYPSMVSYGYDALVSYELKVENTTYVVLRNSDDYSQSWSNVIQIIGVNKTYPKLAIKPKTDLAYGTFLSPINNTAIIYGVEWGHIKSITSPIIQEVDWTNLPGDLGGMWDFSTPNVVYYDTGANIPYLVALIGSTDFYNPDTEEDGSCNNSPMFFWRDPEEPGDFWIAWDPSVENCSNLSAIMEDLSKTLYGVCEIQNGTNTDLLFFNDNPITWTENDYLKTKTISSPDNLTHPWIFLKGDQIYIVAETDSNGKNEIILYKSSDEGDTWSEKIVTAENKPPKPNFSYTAERLNVTFTDLSTDVDGYITNWSWNFGDGNTSNVQNPPKHTYENPGSYTVKLNVKDNDNVEISISKIITLSNTTPIANFTYDPPQSLAGKNVTFNSTSEAYEDSTIDNYTWDFGDGSDLVYEEYVNVTHIYTENGTYIAKLTIRDSTATNDSIEKIIRVGLAADFTFKPNSPLVGETVTFTDASSVTVGQTIMNWSWDFGDGETSYDQDPLHQYSSPGVYTVSLTIKDNNDTTSTMLKQVIVRHISFIPRFPQINANGTDVSIIFNSNSNIYVIDSMDQGDSWSDYLQLNDRDYSVVEEYRFASIADMDHILWTDNREGTFDIYSIIRGFPTGDLMLVPGSVKIKKELEFFPTSNLIAFTVVNNGNTFVENIPVQITVTRENGSIYFDISNCILLIGPNGASKNSTIELFKIRGIEFFRALIDFAALQSITLTVDPEGISGDGNLEDNSFTLSVSFKDLFPILSIFERRFQKIQEDRIRI